MNLRKYRVKEPFSQACVWPHPVGLRKRKSEKRAFLFPKGKRDMDIEITDSVSQSIPAPHDTDLCDGCGEWKKEDKLKWAGERLLCIECRLDEPDCTSAPTDSEGDGI